MAYTSITLPHQTASFSFLLVLFWFVVGLFGVFFLLWGTRGFANKQVGGKGWQPGND